MFVTPPQPYPVTHTQRLSDRNREQRWQWIITTVVLLACGFFALPHDFGLAKYLQVNGVPSALQDVLERAETFAHGIGITAILIVLYVVDLSRRWAIPRVILAVVSAGIAANVIKLLIGRFRPHSADITAHFTDSFTTALPFFSVGSAERGCPSAHTTVVFAFAVGLCWLYPRGRMLFIGLAIFAAAQRLTANAHFLSDVFWGASLGYFVGRGVIAGWLTGVKFNHGEAERYRKSNQSEPIPSSTIPAETPRKVAA